jgi:hypothetical protein
MYDQREALAYSGRLPEQQNKTGITPQLLDLLAIQKVDADKAAAAQKLALAAGQPQPTVAQQLQQKAMQSARQEVMQKMGLAGLQQAQPPQGPMPQQMAEPQGLPGAPSNLPENYRQGGIIAFGSGGDAHGRYRQSDDSSSAPAVDDGPQFTPEQQAMIDAQNAAVVKNRDIDAEALAQQAEAEYRAKVSPARQAAIDAMRERQKGLQALYDRQAAIRPDNFTRGLESMAKNIHAIGGLGAVMSNVGSDIDTANANYATQDINNYKVISDIDAQINEAVANNDLGAYNTLVARRKEAENMVKAGLEAGTSMANRLESTLAGRQRVHEATKQKEAAAILAAETKRQHDADVLLQRQLGFGKLAADKEAAVDAHLRQLALQQATAAAKTALSNPATALQYPEGTTPEDLAMQTYQKYYAMLKSKGPAAPAAPSIAPDRASQFKVLR